MLQNVSTCHKGYIINIIDILFIYNTLTLTYIYIIIYIFIMLYIIDKALLQSLGGIWWDAHFVSHRIRDDFP